MTILFPSIFIQKAVSLASITTHMALSLRLLYPSVCSIPPILYPSHPLSLLPLSPPLSPFHFPLLPMPSPPSVLPLSLCSPSPYALPSHCSPLPMLSPPCAFPLYSHPLLLNFFLNILSSFVVSLLCQFSNGIKLFS